MRRNTYRHSISMIRWSKPTSSVIPPAAMKESTHSTVSLRSRSRSLWSFPTSTSFKLVTPSRYWTNSVGAEEDFWERIDASDRDEGDFGIGLDLEADASALILSAFCFLV